MAKIEVVSKETIKPSSPTPKHLQTFKLSLLDQYAIPHHTMLVLFYAPPSSTRDVSRILKQSLSETLTLFYPLAGRINNHVSVSCHDDGADYVEAQVSCTMAQVLEKPDMEMLNKFVQVSHGLPNTPLLMVQANFFECGGVAVGVSISHRITDAATIGLFIKAWAVTASLGSSSSDVVVPDLTSALYAFPPIEGLKEVAMDFSMVKMDGISRRYVFSSSSIAALKVKATSETILRPTRVEAVSALLWRCSIATSNKPSLLSWIVNFRSSLDPPLPANSTGNIIMPMHVHHSNNESTDLSQLIHRIRNSLKEFGGNFVNKLQGVGGAEALLKKGEEVGRQLGREDLNLYYHISWCKFPFYEADFGWGKPVWATSVHGASVPGLMTFMDARDGEGIEAWVNFADETELLSFETNPEFLAHASSNPSAWSL